MFSLKQKQQISQIIEDALLEIGHPEMPTEKPHFTLHVNGKEAWSWAKITPNWYYENKKPTINPWNEQQEEQCTK